MRALILAAALLGGVAATAHADTTQPGVFAGGTYLVAGPVLIGDRIAWAAQTPAQGNDYDVRLYAASVTGGDAVALAKIGGGTDEQEYSDGVAVGALAGSANGRMAWFTYGWSVQGSKFGSGYFNFQISTLDGPVCAPGDFGTLSLSGDTLAVSGCSGVTVRDLAKGTPPEQLAPAGGDVRVAGTHVAWWTNDGFELLDRSTGARTTLDARSLSGPRRRFDLSPEGVLAVTVGDVHNPHVVWASRAEPAWHTVALPDLSYEQPIRLRGTRLAYMAYIKGRSQLWLTDLAGATPTLLAERDYDVAPDVTEFDFDGTSFTWGTTTCGALTVTAHPIAAGKVTLPETTHCPVIVAGTARGGRIRLRCFGPSYPRESDRCKGTVRISGGGTAKFDLRAFRTGSAKFKTKRRGKVQVTVRSVTRGHASTTKATVELR